ncbi:MAG: hypothetical protein KKA54_17585 [Proteobacteria bacterium]|nr:hypothetical protein [Pseudomonadota bacterium]
MLKNGIGKLVVFVAVLMTFLAAEAAWAGKGDNCNKTLVTIAGIVTDVSRDTCSITVDDATLGLVTVYGIGPASYWLEQGVDLPSIDEKVSIDAYICETLKYVAIEVEICTVPSDPTVEPVCESITLRDEDYLPAWRGGAQTGQE